MKNTGFHLQKNCFLDTKIAGFLLVLGALGIYSYFSTTSHSPQDPKIHACDIALFIEVGLSFQKKKNNPDDVRALTVPLSLGEKHPSLHLPAYKRSLVRRSVGINLQGVLTYLEAIDHATKLCERKKVGESNLPSPPLGC